MTEHEINDVKARISTRLATAQTHLIAAAGGTDIGMIEIEYAQYEQIQHEIDRLIAVLSGDADLTAVNDLP